MSSSLTNSELAYLDIYEQYIDEASFLWLMHTIAVDQPHYRVTELRSLEKRIEAQLNGLTGNLELSWKVMEGVLQGEAEAGEIFTAAVLAFRSHDQNKIQFVVEAALAAEENYKGLLHALVWLPGHLVHDWIKRFFTSKDLSHKWLALQACDMRRENPAEYLLNILRREDCRKNTALYITALKIAGDLKRFDLIEHVLLATDNEDPNIKFWAVRSSILLGDKAQVVKLETCVAQNSELQLDAINIAFRVLPVEEARKWVNKLAEDPQLVRALIIITGVMGDPQAVEWLLQRMQITEFSRVAAEAFCMITGTDLNAMNMTLKEPDTNEASPSEDAGDENVKMHDDENLPWPDVIKLTAYWGSIKNNFVVGQRYLLGNKIELVFLKNNLHTAYQRQRHAIAYEIALMDKNEILFNTRGKVI